MRRTRDSAINCWNNLGMMRAVQMLVLRVQHYYCTNWKVIRTYLFLSKPGSDQWQHAQITYPRTDPTFSLLRKKFADP